MSFSVRTWLLQSFCLSMLFLSATSPLNAQTPSISSVSPMAVKPGGTADVTIRGGNLAGATDFWTSAGFQAVLSPDVKDNGKNAGQVVYRLTVPADTPVGILGLRVATAKGVSPIRLFVVDDLPTVAKTGKNLTPAAAQVLTLPIAVDGTLGSLQRDYYKFTATAGQKVSFEVLARRLGSALDPMIRILDAQGRELAYSDDVAGLRADARLRYQFKTAGDYIVEVRDIRFQGGGNHFYRLRVGDFPCVSVPYPMSVKRGANATVTFAGSHIENVQPVKVAVPADFSQAWLNVGAKRAGGKSSGFATLSVGVVDEFVEAEPNNDPKKPNRVQPGAAINGRFEKPGDVDHFVFAAKKGENLLFSGITRRQGSPTALHIRLLNAAGGQVKVIEDFGVTDAVFNYAIPADGDYTLAVQDLHRRGGTEFAYRISVKPYQAGFVLSASADALNVAAGGTQMITVKSVRKGYNGSIQVAAVDLPAGVTSVPTVIGPGLNTVVLTVTATNKAVAGKIIPIRITGTAKVGKVDFVTTATITDALKTSFNALPWPPQALTKSATLAIAPKPQISLRVEPAQLVFGKGLSATVKVVATRDKGFDEAITLAVTPAKAGLPKGVTVAVKPIPKGKNEISIVFTASNQAALGEFTAALTGTIKQGKVTVVQPAPGVGLKLQAPLKLTVVADAAGKFKQGTQLKLKVTVERNPAAKGVVTLTLQNLPKGVTAAAAKIPADKNELEIVLTATKDATKGAAKKFSIKGELTIGKAKLSAVSGNVSLTVE